MKPVIAKTHHSTIKFSHSIELDAMTTLDITTEFGSKPVNGYYSWETKHPLIIIQDITIYWNKHATRWEQPVKWILFPFISEPAGAGKWVDTTETEIDHFPTLELQFDARQKKWVPIERMDVK